MLVDITFRPFAEDQIQAYREAVEDLNRSRPNEAPICTELKHPARLDRGIYAANGNLNLRTIIEDVTEDVPEFRDRIHQRGASIQDYVEGQRQFKRRMDRLYSQKYSRGPYRDWGGYGAYGLCDSPEQFLAMYPHIADDEVPRFCTFYGIYRKNQPSQGGFRYHKNGEYLGRQRPQHEYLYDDTHIDMICGFHVYRIEGFINN